MTTERDAANHEAHRFQGEWHGDQHNYEFGSPHLLHNGIRSRIIDSIRTAVEERFSRADSCSLLEVGAGHGAFSDYAMAMGADVTVTEMSQPSVEALRKRYGHNRTATIAHDESGTAILDSGKSFDIILCVSVLHHIIDYASFVRRAADMVSEGGSLLTFQDPLWYSRRSRRSRLFEKVLFSLWRLGQGNLARGFGTQVRRFRHIVDHENPSDMVEYHVVRQGVDEEALLSILRDAFEGVEICKYFSTPSHIGQSIGQRFASPTTFGLSGTRRKIADQEAM